MKNWKSLFRDIILERGYDYYLQGLVEDYQEDDGVINATVCGSDDYEVGIKLINGKINDAYCSCPYAEDGNYCKHMAAVLYEYEEKQEISANARSVHADQTVEEIVAAADEQYVRDFLTGVLMGNNLLWQRFRMDNPNREKRSLSEYEKLVDNIIVDHEDYDGYVDYYAAQNLIDDLLDLSDDIRAMIERGDYMDVFELSYYICEQIDMTEMDDDGGISMLFEEMTGFWYEIADSVSPEEKDELFESAVTYLDSDLNYLGEFIESFIYTAFREPRFIPRIFEWLDNTIKNTNQDTYAFPIAVLGKLDLMNDLGTRFDRIEKVCDEYWTDHHVRQWLAEQYEKKSEYQKALSIYEESLSLDTKYPGLIYQYHEKLLRLYQKIGNHEKYMEYLWMMVTEDKKSALYKELKSQYTAGEWLTEREKVFPHYSPLGQADLFCEEKLYDRLWEVIKDQHINSIMSYEDVLLPKYRKEILNTYITQLNRMAVAAGGRKEYQYWVRILKHMKKIKGGNEMADQIVADWKIRYKNRRAMLDELKNL